VACPCGHPTCGNIWIRKLLVLLGMGVYAVHAGMGWAVRSGAVGSQTSPSHYDVWSVPSCLNTLLSSALCYATGTWVSTNK
jgi:hypothetical protein